MGGPGQTEGGSRGITGYSRGRKSLCLVLAELWGDQLVPEEGRNSGSLRVLCVLCVFLCVLRPSPGLGCQLGRCATGNIPTLVWAEAGHLPLRASSLMRFSDSVSPHSSAERFTEQAWEPALWPGPPLAQACIPAFTRSQAGLAEGGVHYFWPVLYVKAWEKQRLTPVCPTPPAPL